MNKYLKTIKAETISIKAATEKMNEDLKSLDDKNKLGSLSPNDYEAQKAAIKANYQAAKSEAINHLTGLEQQYSADYDEWATLDGSKIDSADVALLNSGIDLQETDLRKLQEKHSGNYSMMRAIESAANRSKIILNSGYTTDKATKMNELRSVMDRARNAIHTPNGYDMTLWATESNFENIYAVTDTFTALGE